MLIGLRPIHCTHYARLREFVRPEHRQRHPRTSLIIAHNRQSIGNLRTMVIRPSAWTESKLGASADTSQRYTPDDRIVRPRSVTFVLSEYWCCGGGGGRGNELVLVLIRERHKERVNKLAITNRVHNNFWRFESVLGLGQGSSAEAR